MTHSNFILIYWKKEQVEFNKNLEILGNGPDKNAVHDLRVAIKKLRACLKLYVIITEKKEGKELFNETRNLFSILGKERDIEICLELLTAYEKENNIKFSNLKIYLQSQLEITQTWSQHALKNYHEKELANLTLLLNPGAEVPDKDWLIKKTIDAINDHLRQIKGYYKQPHKMRKLLKDVYYWLKMLPQNTIKKKELENKLEKILDDFGNWQNDEIFLVKCKHFRKDDLPDPLEEYKLLKTLEKKIEERKEKLLKDVLHKTNQLPKKVSAA